MLYIFGNSIASPLILSLIHLNKAFINHASPEAAHYMGSIPGLGKSPGEGNDNLLQYSCLENPMGRGAWQTTYSPLGL